MIGARMPIWAYVGQDADERGRDAHDRDRHEERELAADDVADAAEDRGAERSDGEARAEGRQRGEQRRGRRCPSGRTAC